MVESTVRLQVPIYGKMFFSSFSRTLFHKKNVKDGAAAR